MPSGQWRIVPGRDGPSVQLLTTSAYVAVQSETSAIRAMAASARGEMVSARGELLGARVAVAQTFIAARDGLGYLRSLAPGVAAAPIVLV